MRKRESKRLVDQGKFHIGDEVMIPRVSLTDRYRVTAIRVGGPPPTGYEYQVGGRMWHQEDGLITVPARFSVGDSVVLRLTPGTIYRVAEVRVSEHRGFEYKLAHPQDDAGWRAESALRSLEEDNELLRPLSKYMPGDYVRIRDDDLTWLVTGVRWQPYSSVLGEWVYDVRSTRDPLGRTYYPEGILERVTRPRPDPEFHVYDRVWFNDNVGPHATRYTVMRTDWKPTSRQWWYEIRSDRDNGLRRGVMASMLTRIPFSMRKREEDVSNQVPLCGAFWTVFGTGEVHGPCALSAHPGFSEHYEQSKPAHRDVQRLDQVARQIAVRLTPTTSEVTQEDLRVVVRPGYFGGFGAAEREGRPDRVCDVQVIYDDRYQEPAVMTVRERHAWRDAQDDYEYGVQYRSRRTSHETWAFPSRASAQSYVTSMTPTLAAGETLRLVRRLTKSGTKHAPDNVNTDWYVPS